ncbi:uncharacterized protein LOC117504348 [Thalassophryne amazonica]|uniref:uncharacterized protein LOC117504348 n=1 Tax=Thalassophryne amazonica TaxID=390379 RepID=UPI001470BB5E|nr:uncharacterized protein LOC117504348 [Thalassophryne amazonica]
MGNLPFLTRSDAVVSEKTNGFKVRSIRRGITYYCAPLAAPGALYPASDRTTPCSPPPDSCLCDASSRDTSSTHLLSDPRSSSSPRPLLLFFAWLGAQPGAVAKYWDLYLDRGMDVLLVQSSVMDFLWPRWGLEYGAEILKVLEKPEFSGRPVLVHATSIGGYTFSQLLIHISQGQTKSAALAQRVTGTIFDSLVAGTLEHMAAGLGKTLAPRLEGFIKNAVTLYFWLFRSCTVDFYNRGVEVFHNNPITSPALLFYSENDAMCDLAVLENVIASWKERGVTVKSRKWKKSVHAAHMRCHPEEYLSTLNEFLNSLPQSRNVIY